MPSFGIVVLNRDQEQTYYREIGRNANRIGLTVHRFIPKDIDPYTEKVTGETFNAEKNEWRREIFPIPDILYDRCFYTSRQTYKINAPIVEWLKNRTTFLGFGLPNKWKVYESLREDPYLGDYTIDSIKAERADLILNELEQRKTILLKPETGSQGKGILVIKKLAGSLIVQTTDRRGKILQKTFSTKLQLTKWLDIQLKRTTFLLQPFLTLQNKQKQPFDIRIVVQKDSHGKWTERGRGVRLGQTGGFVSNLHSNGKIVDFEQWLDSLAREKRSFIENELSAILERIPPVLETAFGPLFELGLDIGIDREGAIWILEANSKPGHRTLLESGQSSRAENAQAPLQYAKHLLKQKELNEYAAAVDPAKN